MLIQARPLGARAYRPYRPNYGGSSEADLRYGGKHIGRGKDGILRPSLTQDRSTCKSKTHESSHALERLIPPCSTATLDCGVGGSAVISPRRPSRCAEQSKSGQRAGLALSRPHRLRRGRRILLSTAASGTTHNAAAVRLLPAPQCVVSAPLIGAAELDPTPSTPIPRRRVRRTSCAWRALSRR